MYNNKAAGKLIKTKKIFDEQTELKNPPAKGTELQGTNKSIADIKINISTIIKDILNDLFSIYIKIRALI